MVELAPRLRVAFVGAGCFRRIAGSYLATHGPAMPRSRRRAIADRIGCRTEAL